MKEIEFLIDGEGKVQVRYKGYKGKSCFTAAEEFYKVLKGLGVDADILKTEVTEEYYEEEAVSERARA